MKFCRFTILCERQLTVLTKAIGGVLLDSYVAVFVWNFSSPEKSIENPLI